MLESSNDQTRLPRQAAHSPQVFSDFWVPHPTTFQVNLPHKARPTCPGQHPTPHLLTGSSGDQGAGSPHASPDVQGCQLTPHLPAAGLQARASPEWHGRLTSHPVPVAGLPCSSQARWSFCSPQGPFPGSSCHCTLSAQPPPHQRRTWAAPSPGPWHVTNAQHTVAPFACLETPGWGWGWEAGLESRKRYIYS